MLNALPLSQLPIVACCCAVADAKERNAKAAAAAATSVPLPPLQPAAMKQFELCQVPVWEGAGECKHHPRGPVALILAGRY
jgi:hypothetical protein